VATTFDFIGVGGLSYDLVLQVDRLPSSDDKIPGSLIGKLPGGFIANATCAAARLGLNTGYIGWIGDDVDGDMLADEFVQYGVDIGGLEKVPGEVTPFTVILVKDDGERAIIIPSSALYRQELSKAQLAYAEQANVILTYPRDEERCRLLADRVHSHRGLFALDVESSSPLTGEALRRVIELSDVVFISEGSLPLLEEVPLESFAERRWVILTAGKYGSYGLAPGLHERVFQSALPVQAVDTTGAGDCFHAAVLAARHHGATLAEALAFASAAAAIKVQHRGARGGLPTRTEVERFCHAAEKGV
jgi:sugar/nucleoside kinase (ribokinase family)